MKFIGNNTRVIDKFNGDVSNRRITLSKLASVCTVSEFVQMLNDLLNTIARTIVY